LSKILKNIKFYENLATGSRVIPDGQTDEWRDKAKLTVTFHNFANVPKNRGKNNN
jgi:hypothetical protein